MRTIRSASRMTDRKPDTMFEMFNSTDVMDADIVNNSYSTHDEQAEHLETYIIPTIMTCPLVISIYVIIRLYRKLKQLNRVNNMNPPMWRLSAYETEL